MILVTGATGTAGGAVVRELLGRGIRGVRAMHRSAKDLAGLPAGAEGVQGDFADPASLRRALDGVETAYLVCAPVPDLVQLETNFLLACRDAKVGHVVINSALGAEDFPKSFPAWHRKVEDKARELGLPATVLRPNGFMQNIVTYFSPTIRSQDTFYGAIGDAKISLIDVADVAAAAARALTSKETIGKVYEISGPEAIGFQDLAARLSKVTGRTIRYVNLATAQMHQAMTGAGMPAAQATSIVELDEYYISGKGAASDMALRQILDREPKTIDAFLAENRSQFSPATTA